MKKFFTIAMVTMSVMLAMAMGPKEALAATTYYTRNVDPWLEDFQDTLEDVVSNVYDGNCKILFQSIEPNNNGGYTWAGVAKHFDSVKTDTVEYDSALEVFATTWYMRIWAFVN